MFWVVARWLLGCSGRLLCCSEWLLGRCYAVARVFWVVARALLGSC